MGRNKNQPKLGLLGRPKILPNGKRARREENPLGAGIKPTHVKKKSKIAHKSPNLNEPPKWRLASPLHQQCATIIGRLLQAQNTQNRGATLKGLCLAAHVQNKAAVYAVVCETLRFLPALREILVGTDFCSEHTEISESSVYVLLYDLLIGQGVRPQGRAERAFLSSEEDFKLLSQRILDKAKVKKMADLLPKSAQREAESTRPRTLRVNTLKSTVEDAVFRLKNPLMSWDVKHRKGMKAAIDEHLPDLISLPAGTDMHDHPLVKNGTLIQQGKSSCIPGHVLAAEPGWHVADCCAAPGNKTSHAAACVGTSGRVVAFEKDPKRGQLLSETLARAGAKHVEVNIQDFFIVDPTDRKYGRIQGVILDPSCSGSGTGTSRMDYLLPLAQPVATTSAEANTTEESKSIEEPSTHEADPLEAAFPGCTSDTSPRVLSLAEFQKKILRHALQFPGLKRLVYSTCSVYRQENEDVIADVLPYATELGFSLGHALPQWPRRGLPLEEYSWSEKLVRVHPKLDVTDGFFVALFEKIE